MNETEFKQAQAEYHRAAGRMGAALRAWVGAQVKAAYATATKVNAYGEYGEEGTIRFRLQQVLDADGRTLDDIEEPTPALDDLTDLVDPYLDWLADLNGDDYLGDHELDLDEAEPVVEPPAVVVVYRHPDAADEIKLYGLNPEPLVVYMDCGSFFDVTHPCAEAAEEVRTWADGILEEIADLPEGHGARTYVSDVVAQTLAEFDEYLVLGREDAE